MPVPVHDHQSEDHDEDKVIALLSDRPEEHGEKNQRTIKHKPAHVSAPSFVEHPGQNQSYANYHRLKPHEHLRSEGRQDVRYACDRTSGGIHPPCEEHHRIVEIAGDHHRHERQQERGRESADGKGGHIHPVFQTGAAAYEIDEYQGDKIESEGLHHSGHEHHESCDERAVPDHGQEAQGEEQDLDVVENHVNGRAVDDQRTQEPQGECQICFSAISAQVQNYASDDECHRQIHQGAGGVLKGHGGRQPQNQVPDHPAAHGSDQPQNTHSKQVHPLFQAREGPRGGKGHGPDEIDNPNKRFDGRHLQTMRLP